MSPRARCLKPLRNHPSHLFLSFVCNLLAEMAARGPVRPQDPPSVCLQPQLKFSNDRKMNHPLVAKFNNQVNLGFILVHVCQDLKGLANCLKISKHFLCPSK